MSTMIFDSDDFGCNHEISGMCQSHDCRDILEELKRANTSFKCTLFTIPAEVTHELLDWHHKNMDWVELALHGFTHSSNYECETMGYQDFENNMLKYLDVFGGGFVKGFKAPGWQISNDCYKWLLDSGWWVADQAYNDGRRPTDLLVYKLGPHSVHTHTWNCVGNGVYELFDELVEKVKATDDFKFVSEVVA